MKSSFLNCSVSPSILSFPGLWRSLGCGLLCLSLLGLAGCKKIDLFSQLSENEANQMMAILLKNGINSQKAPAKENKWIVKVEEGRFSDAVGLMERSGLPRENFEGLGQVFQKSGLVSSPSEERIRFIHALSEELSETLSCIDGVLKARVQVVLPDNDPYSDKTKPSSASIFLKYRYDANMEEALPKIKNLVVNSIEGLSFDKVTVAAFPTDSLPTRIENGRAYKMVAGLNLAPESADSFYLILAASLGTIGVLLALLAGVVIIHLRFKKSVLGQVAMGSSGAKP